MMPSMLTAGTYDTMPWIFPPPYLGTSCMNELWLQQLKKEVQIPVIAVGSILSTCYLLKIFFISWQKLIL